jgi:hypothetical protein
LRVLAGILFVYYLLPFAGHLGELFGMAGWFDAQAYRDMSTFPGLPQFNWSLAYLCGFDPSPELLGVVFCASLAVLMLFILGVYPRLTGVLTWVVVGSFIANPATMGDAEWLLPIVSFYLMLGYVLTGQLCPDRPLTWRLLGPLSPFTGPGRDNPFWRRPSVGANIGMRMLQVHFAIVMVTSALHKLQSADWWAGWALWYPLHPALSTSLSDVMDMRPSAGPYFFLLSLATYVVLAWQLCFPLFAWRHGNWRFILLGGAAVGALGLVFLYRDPVLGPLFVVFCLSYLTPAEWQWLLARLPRLPGLRRQPAAAERTPRRPSVAESSALATPR